MALPTNTITTYSVIGNRESLSDIIYSTSPTDTIFLSNVDRSAKATGKYHEWIVDDLAAAGSNAKLEGDDATAAALTAGVRVGNYCQISSKTVVVAGTQEAVDSAGNVGSMSYQIAKVAKELKRDMEYALVRNQASAAGGIGTARTSAGLESWLSSNYISVGTGTAQTTPGFSAGIVAAPTDSTIAGTFTEASLKSALLKAYNNGGNPTMLMVSARNKQVASAFTGIATQYKDNKNEPAAIVGAADIYISDFGQLSIVANRFMRDTTAIAVDFDYVKVAYLRDMQLHDLAKTGDAEKKQLLCEFTLQMSSEKAHCKVVDVG